MYVWPLWGKQPKLVGCCCSCWSYSATTFSLPPQLYMPPTYLHLQWCTQLPCPTPWPRVGCCSQHCGGQGITVVPAVIMLLQEVMGWQRAVQCFESS